MNYSRILMSVTMVAFVGALVVGGTGAFFNDTETSTGNVFTAGALDLKVDSVAHYNGLVCFGGLWHPEETVVWNDQLDPPQLELIVDDPALADAIAAYQAANPAANPTAGDDCVGTWQETDLGPETFFFFEDLKPGDSGENTISLHVYNNDAYACAIIDDMVDADNGQTEPELEDGDDESEQGELSQELRFFAWADDGDNIWEPGENERPLFSNTEGPASDVIDGVVYPLFTPQTGVLQATTTEYIGLYWCYGAISTEGDQLSCDGSEVTNLTQTDSLSASFTFYVEQARNNEDFQCPVLEEPEPQEVAGAALDAYAEPTTCDVDVSGDDELSAALAGATIGQTLCLDDQDGVYSGPITVSTEGLTLAAVGSPLISGGVIIDAPGVTVTGFEIIPGSTEGSTAGVYLKEAADNATISYNYINSIGVTLARGILNVIGTDLPGVTIDNNVIEGDGTGSGIYTNPHTGMWTISNNDIFSWAAGIGQWNGANVLNNEFSGGGEAMGVDSAWDANGGVMNFNNFLDGSEFNTYGAITGTIDAENNFFNIGGATQVDDQGATVDVDYDPEALVQFPHS